MSEHQQGVFLEDVGAMKGLRTFCLILPGMEASCVTVMVAPALVPAEIIDAALDNFERLMRPLCGPRVEPPSTTPRRGRKSKEPTEPPALSIIRGGRPSGRAGVTLNATK